MAQLFPMDPYLSLGRALSGRVPLATTTTEIPKPIRPYYQAWKQQYAPHDSGEDYDLQGAFLHGVTPDPVTGHFPDTWKKPNEPTFSNQSIYANLPGANPGHWEGPNQDQFVPGTGPLAPQVIPKEAYSQLMGLASGPNDRVYKNAFDMWVGDKLAKSKLAHMPQDLIQSTVDKYTYPHDALMGLVDPLSDEGIKRGLNFAANTTLPALGRGGAAAVEMAAGNAVRDPNQLNAIIGNRGFGSNLLTLAKAKKQYQKFEDPLFGKPREMDYQTRENIYEDTGWYRDPLGGWATIQPDTGLRLNPAFDYDKVIRDYKDQLRAQNPGWSESTIDIKARANAPNMRVGQWDPTIEGQVGINPLSGNPTAMGSIIDWPTVELNYPHLANRDTSLLFAHGDSVPSGAAWGPGTYLGGGMNAPLAADYGTYSRGPTNASVMGAQAHETAHGIQDFQGWVTGSDPDLVRRSVLEKMEPMLQQAGIDPAWMPDPYTLYRSSGGEQNAVVQQQRALQYLAGQPVAEGTPFRHVGQPGYYTIPPELHTDTDTLIELANDINDYGVNKTDVNQMLWLQTLAKLGDWGKARDILRNQGKTQPNLPGYIDDF